MKRIILLALVLNFSPFIAFADEHSGCGCMKQMVQELNLTTEQKQKIEAIKLGTKQKFQAQKDEMKSLHNQMKNLIKSDKIDQTKLDSLVNQKKEIMGAIMKEKIVMKNQIYNVLDNTQKEKFMSMMDRKMDKKGHDNNSDNDDDDMQDKD
jgi:protein CpxP